jgi:Fe-S-cluster containining protein
MPDDTRDKPHPCLTCGACCAYFRASFYWAEADDETPGWVPVEMTRKLNEHRMSLIAKLIVCNSSEKSKITLKK